jgi:hypothetical protein
MKRTIAMLLLSLVTLTAQDHYFRFEIENRPQLDKLTQIISIDKVEGKAVTAYANDSEWKAFEKLNIPYEKLPLPTTLFIPKMADNAKDIKEWDSYPTYTAYVDFMEDFAANYPDICQLIEIGTSVQGRKLLAVKISDNVTENESEPEFFYTGTMHGDETTGYILLLRLIDTLLEGYGTDSRLTNLMNNLEIFINPLANPDGTYYGGNNTVFGARRYNANGYDINRNFPDPAAGQNPNGPWQPETIAMMDWAEAHNFVMSANFHGGIEVANYPWDTWSVRHPDDAWWQIVSRAYADAAQTASPAGYFDDLNNGITNGYDWYRITGGRQDYYNYFHGCRELTLEVSNDKLLPESQLNALWNYNYNAMLTYMEFALQGIHGVIKDGETDAVIPAKIEVTQITGPGNWVRNEAENGDYTRLLLPGTYTLLVTPESELYQPRTINNITVSSGNLTTLDIIYLPPESGLVNGTIHYEDQTVHSGIKVEVKDPQTAIWHTQFTNENGYFEFPSIYIGDVQAKFSSPGYGTRTASGNLEADDTLTFSDTLLNVTAMVNGLVLLSDTTDASGVEVLLQSVSASESQITANDGLFQFEDVIPGVYTISFRKEGYISKYQSLNVTNYDSLWIEKFLNPADSAILLIDDDESSGLSTSSLWIKEKMDSLGFNTILETPINTSPENWSDYAMIFWNSARNANPLAYGVHQQGLADYCGNGGFLFISGGDIAYKHASHQPFAAEVLGISSYNGDGGYDLILSNPPHSVLGRNLPDFIDYSYQSFADQDNVTPNANAQLLYSHQNQENKGGLLLNPNSLYLSLNASRMDEAVFKQLVKNAVNYRFSSDTTSYHYDLEILGLIEIPDSSYLEKINADFPLNQLSFVITNRGQNAFNDTVALSAVDYQFCYDFLSPQFKTIIGRSYTWNAYLSIESGDTVEVQSETYLDTTNEMAFTPLEGYYAVTLAAGSDQNPDNNEIKLEYIAISRLWSSIFNFENGLGNWTWEGDSVWTISDSISYFGKHSLKLGGASSSGKVKFTISTEDMPCSYGACSIAWLNQYPFDLMQDGDTLRIFNESKTIWEYLPGDTIMQNHFSHYFLPFGEVYVNSFISALPLHIEWSGNSGNALFLDEIHILDYSLMSSIGEKNNYPTKFTLASAYPNPFNPSVTLPYYLPQNSPVKISIYNIAGQKIQQIAISQQQTGWQHFIWNGTNYFGENQPSGIYLIQINNNQSTATQKVILLR